MQSSETRYCLRIETGERKGETIPLREGVATLGRRSDNTFVLSAGSVSGRHAEIKVENGRVELSDLGSTNGTKVSGRRVDSSALAHGDEIALGSYKLVLLDTSFIEGGHCEEGDGPVPEDDTIQIEEAAPATQTDLHSPASPLAEADSDGLQRVSADKVRASGSRSRLGLLALGLIAAAAVAVCTWRWRNKQGGVGRAEASVVELDGNLLAGGTFEKDRAELDWSGPETAPQVFARERAFAHTGRFGLGVDLAQGEWALARSPIVELSSAVSSRGLELVGSLRATGSAEGRLGVEFLTGASDGGSTFVWAPAQGAPEVGFMDRSVALVAPPGHRHARIVVAGRGIGEVAIDDVGLFEADRSASLTTHYNEIEFRVLGQAASTATLVRAGRSVFRSLQLGRWDARGLEGSGRAGWSASAGQRGFKVLFDGGPTDLWIVVDESGIDLGGDERSWIATSGSTGYRSHSSQFERAGANSIFLGRGSELVRIGFAAGVSVRGERLGEGVSLSIQLGTNNEMDVQLSFVEERTEASVLVSRADEAERRGRIGAALAAWSELLDRYPIERGQVKRAEEARARLIGEGLDEVAEIRAAFERARFFALPELYRQGRERCRVLSERYEGSEVEVEAERLDRELALELETASSGGAAKEGRQLEGVLKALDRQAQPRLTDHVKRALSRRQGVSVEGAATEETGGSSTKKEDGSDG